MNYTTWLILIGALLIFVAVTRSLLRRLTLTLTMLYLLVGFVLGPAGLSLDALTPIPNAGVVERITEMAVIVSLFIAGLKMGFPSHVGYWRVAVRLAFGSMVLTVAMITLVGMYVLNLPLGAALLLGAILAPTDPVLASDVQLINPNDRDTLRVGLTGEAGLNDGTAFPFVMLGLGLLGLHDIGDFGWRWVAVDLVWGILGGLAVGAALGYLIGRLIVYLRSQRKEESEFDEFLALGLIALSYGVAIFAHSYGFLAVFAAGVGLRYSEQQYAGGVARMPASARAGGLSSEDVIRAADTSPTHATQEVLRFNEQAEHVGEFVVVLLIGVMLSPGYFNARILLFIALLFLLVRPASVWLGLLGSSANHMQRGLVAWCGIRGIGSLYYLAYAANHGLSSELVAQLTAITLAVVTLSIFIHGFTAPVLMRLYVKKQNGSKDS